MVHLCHGQDVCAPEPLGSTKQQLASYTIKPPPPPPRMTTPRPVRFRVEDTRCGRGCRSMCTAGGTVGLCKNLRRMPFAKRLSHFSPTMRFATVCENGWATSRARNVWTWFCFGAMPCDSADAVDSRLRSLNVQLVGTRGNTSSSEWCAQRGWV